MLLLLLLTPVGAGSGAGGGGGGSEIIEMLRKPRLHPDDQIADEILALIM